MACGQGDQVCPDLRDHRQENEGYHAVTVLCRRLARRLASSCGAGGSWSATCRVGLGEVAGRPPRVRGEHNAPGNALRRAGSGLAAVDRVGAVLGGVGQGRVAQPVQRPPGTHAKQFGRPPVRQPGPPAGRIQVQAGDRRGSAGGHPGRPVRRSGRPAGGGAAGPTRSARTPTRPRRPCCAPAPAGWPGPGPPRPGPAVRWRGRRSRTAAATGFAPAAGDRGGQTAARAGRG